METKKNKKSLLHGKICVKNGNERIFMPKRDIIMFYKEGRKTKMITNEGPFLINASLSQVEERLQTKHFFRTHQSYLVNVQKIKKIEYSEYENYVHLEGTEEKALITKKQEKSLYEMVEMF